LAGCSRSIEVVDLSGRVALITGGGRGLGRAMALALAQAGASVAITGATASTGLDQTVADMPAGRGLALAADVTSDEDCARAVQSTLAAFGRIDMLVNNAGRGMRLVSETFTSDPVKFWTVPTDVWAKIMDINVDGAFRMAKAVMPQFLAQGSGRIVNISTSDQTMVRRGYAPYGPSKAALEAASRIWAQDAAGTGVCVNVLLPGGASDTDLLPGGPGRRGADGNLLPPQIMGPPIVWLLSDSASTTTGRRMIARLFDPALPPDEAAARAMTAIVDKPLIL
jgi:NAD(P)-dependent dehydrogenase (short-subunit alcohol dehydrogenase family)